MRFLKIVAACCLVTGLGYMKTMPVMAQTVSGNSETAVGIQLTSSEQEQVRAAENWVNGITILKAHFQQLAPNNQHSTGTVWIHRPGRIRFEYDKPSQLLLVANEGKMVFHDGAVDQTTVIPIDQNPLGLLLKPQLHFSGDVTLTNFQQGQDEFQITVVRTVAPSEGSLTLVFDAKTKALKAWRVVDAQRQVTQVDLSDVHPKKSVSDKLFDIHFKDGE